MAHWLFKTEAEVFGWDDQVALGPAGGEWDGVRNYQARNHMRTMEIGDTGFFYLSGKDRKIVGIVTVVARSHRDSTTEDPRWDCVDVAALRPFETAVTLEQIKARADLSDMVLVRNSRLSVQPVADAEWQAVCAMGRTAP